jgi:hypothetical protein
MDRGEHFGIGSRIVQAGLDNLAIAAENEPEHASQLESRLAVTFTLRQIAARYGVTIGTVCKWPTVAKSTASVLYARNL